MKINAKNTKTMLISKSGEGTINITLNDETIEQVTKFKYLGAIITANGKCEDEITARIAVAKTAFQ